MSWIDERWLQSAFDSMRRTFYEIDPQLKREMIQFLLDEGFWDAQKLTWDAAVARFNACLNPNKADTFFKLGEIWALMKRFERFDLLIAMADDLGFDLAPRPTEARRQQLLLRIAEATEKCTAAVEGARAELDRLADVPVREGPSGIARAAGRPQFSRCREGQVP
jgi:hypothetical protein